MAQWSKEIRFLSHLFQGACIGLAGLLIWPANNWKFWVWVILMTLALAAVETNVEGPKEE